MQKRDWGYAMMLGVVHIVTALAHKWFFGLTMYYADWNSNWHAIPIPQLRDNLWDSLFYLHYQPPLYNLFGAVFINLSPDYFREWIWYINIGLCALMVVMLYVIGKTIIPNRKMIILVTFFLAINPTFIIHQASLLYTIHVTFGLTLSVFGVALFQQTRKNYYLGLVVFGAVLTILTRSSFLVFLLIPILITIGILAEYRWKRVVLIGLLISTPAWGWFIKNMALYGIISSSGAGYNMQIIATADYSRHALQNLVRDGVLDDTIFMPRLPPSLYAPLGYDKTSDSPLLAQDNIHNINIPDIFARMMKNGLAIIRHDPIQYLSNVYRGYKIFSIIPYDASNPVEWHSDWMYQWDWRRSAVVYDDITDFLMHGRHLIEPLTSRLGIISVNSWLFFFIPVSLFGFWLVMLVTNRLNLRRWCATIRQNATLVFVAFYALYGLLIYTFLEIGENDRFRGELEPFYFLMIVAVAYQYLWKSAHRRRYALFFGGLLIGWTVFAMVMDNPYLRKPVYTAPIQAEGHADGHVFGDVLKLTWREPIISDHQTQIEIPLYWEILRPTDAIYSATIQLIDAEQNRITGIDVVLGAAMPPFITTSRWQVGQILRESVILDLPLNAPPIADVMVNVFRDTDWQNSLVYTLPDGTPTGDKFLRLQSFGMDREGIYPQADMPPVNFAFDEVQVAFTSNSFNNGMLTLEGVMTATSTPTQDYILFFHVVDTNGRMVQQSDSLYLSDNWVTSALIPNRPIKFIREIALPYVAGIGEYVVKFGAYTLPSTARLPLLNGDGMRLPDDMGEWGRVQVIDD
jgi:hypothetical protein